MYATPAPFSGLDPLTGQRTLADIYREDNPQSTYQWWNDRYNPRGGDWTTPYGRFTQSQYDPLYRQYESVLPDRGMNFSWVDFLNEKGPGLESTFRGLSPQQRGERPGSFGQSRLRWVGF